MQLNDAGFKPENKIGKAETYDSAKALIEDNAAHLDVVFLDLNIPRNESDGRPEKGHGAALLDLIHKNLNQRAGIDIKVIVVSGEDLHDGMQSDIYKEYYKGTLCGIVKKNDLKTMLKSSLKQLKRDPIRSRIQRNNVDVLTQYDVIYDSSQPTLERIKAARKVGIKLLQNEIDHHKGFLNASADCADDLNGLLKNYVENRFSGRVKVSTVSHPANWNEFLWRGTMIQHLYTLNSYRNNIEHLEERPFRNVTNHPAVWEIPTELLSTLESGSSVTKIAELIVKDMLEWYLPWHEQVYVPWRNQLPGE
jgi:hypothetical protein